MAKLTTKLTKAEEEIMQLIWQKERCTVSDLLDTMDAPKPPHSSISSIVRILERKGFVGHKAYGKTYEYFPLVAKEDYGQKTLMQFMSDYFDGSAANLVSFLVKDEQLDSDELHELLKKLDEKS
jgi:BlaI family transcriptional regulator, penicillinase repressor